MGQLRSALSAASRVADGPAQALDVLGLYARSVDGAESTTVVDDLHRLGQPHHHLQQRRPPAARPACTPTAPSSFLDQATDPPLGARPEHVPRPQAARRFAEGATLVLYTDGLIERRDEDIDTGLARLADSLARHRQRRPRDPGRRPAGRPAARPAAPPTTPPWSSSACDPFAGP